MLLSSLLLPLVSFRAANSLKLLVWKAALPAGDRVASHATNSPAEPSLEGKTSAFAGGF